MDTSHFQALSAWLDCLRESTRPNYLLTLQGWCKFLGRPWSGRVSLRASAQDCYRYISWMRSQGLSEGTIKYKRMVLRRAYRVLVECDVLPKNPWNAVLIKFTSEQIRPSELIPDEAIARIIDAPKGKYRTRDRALLALLFGGGLRIGEAVALNANNFQRRNGLWCVWLARTKAGVSLWHSLPEWAGEIVQEAARQQTIKGVETPLIGGWGASRLSVHRARQIFQSACVAATGRRYNPHSARATAVTKLLRDGVPVDKVQIFSRHKKVESLMWYDKRTKDETTNPGIGLNFGEMKRGENRE